MADATDCQLLERFVNHRDEAAFAALARRHAAVVLALCRRILRDEQDAQDVAQATFLVLARKAVAVPWHDSVGNWLSAVAYRLALNARAASARQRRRERPAGTLRPDDSGEAAGATPAAPDDDPADAAARLELHGVLHEEVGRLPEKYRAPVVLCYLEGKTNEQAARELGWPTGSMSRRLERARQLLRQRLSGRGLALWTAVVCLVLAPCGLSNRAPAVVPGHGRPGVEAALLRVADGGEVEAERLIAMADEAAASAGAMRGHDPGRRRGDWQRHAEEMRAAAGELSRSARARDRSGTVLAAGRLHAACTHCHQSFRE
jgi:RNA polymerase sigma-70 factor (ECF subfamily)